jgi:hypothetical protein
LESAIEGAGAELDVAVRGPLDPVNHAEAVAGSVVERQQDQEGRAGYG